MRSTAQVGLENVSVEALAKTLNATKGSFYWHFTDRAELVDAALAEWQRRTTTEVFDGIGHAPTEDPVARLMDRVLSLGRADDEATRRFRVDFRGRWNWGHGCLNGFFWGV